MYQLFSLEYNSFMYASRLQSLHQYMAEHHLDGYIVSKKENIFYLTGTETIHPTNREAILLVTPTQAVLYHSSFIAPYRLDFLTTIPMSQNGYQEILAATFSDSQSIGFEAQNLTVAELERLKTVLPSPKYIPTQNVLEEARITKDNEEIRRIKIACEISAKGMNWIHNIIMRNSHKKITEIEVAKRLENKFYELGANDLAYPTIVAFDAHSALPHHQPTASVLTPESVVLIDAGCKYMGYCSDMTRTFKLGTKSQEFKNVEDIIKTAYNNAITITAEAFTTAELTTKNEPKQTKKTITSSLPTAAEVDAAARDYIISSDYGDKYIHSTGHGLGLEIHEQPSVYHTNPTPLSANTTFTIEPGIYLEGKFGYRHENTILLT
jgi:Xaa-Pro aminopeptidase